MERRKVTFIAAQALSLTLVAVVLSALPDVPSLPTLAASAAVWGVTFAAYRFAGHGTVAGRYWLLALTLVLCVGVVLNYHLLTTAQGVSPRLPLFHNFDMARYYYGATFVSGTGEGYLESRNAMGYAVVISMLWKLTGWSLLSPLMLNALAALLTVVFSGVLTRRLLAGAVARSGEWLMTAGMVAAGSVCYLTFSGTLLMKESLTALSLVVAALSVLMLRRGRAAAWAGALLFVGSCAVIGILRHHWVVIPVVGLLVAAVGGDWRRWLTVGAVGVVAVAVCLCCENLILTASDATMHIPDVNQLEDNFIIPSTERDAYYQMLGRIGYFNGPWWRRLLWLPLTAVVQFLTPFPWNFAKEIGSSVTLAAVKFSYPWYVVGGLTLYYWWRCARRSPSLLLMVTAWAALFWLGFAWFCGGTVSRYAYNLVPLLVPAAVYAFACGYGTKGFRRWAVVYSIMIAVALASAYVIQHFNCLSQ